MQFMDIYLDSIKDIRKLNKENDIMYSNVRYKISNTLGPVSNSNKYKDKGYVLCLSALAIAKFAQNKNYDLKEVSEFLAAAKKDGIALDSIEGIVMLKKSLNIESNNQVIKNVLTRNYCIEL